MIKIKAHIKLFEGDEKRTVPIENGYRPLFRFIEDTMVSGRIQILENCRISPGDSSIVEIAFISNQFLGSNFRKGATFKFYEGLNSVGEGEILEVLES